MNGVNFPMIDLGVFAPHLAEQLGVDADTRLNTMQQTREAINFLRIHGYISAATIKSAERKLIGKLYEYWQERKS